MGDEARMAMHPNNISPREEFVTYARCARSQGLVGEPKGKGQVDVSKCVSIYYFPEKLSCGRKGKLSLLML
jgi:hypothetical protein